MTKIALLIPRILNAGSKLTELVRMPAGGMCTFPHGIPQYPPSEVDDPCIEDAQIK
jgi:hypothetical protein